MESFLQMSDAEFRIAVRQLQELVSLVICDELAAKDDITDCTDAQSVINKIKDGKF